MEAQHYKKLKIQSFISKLILIIGFMLLVFMIIVEDEPGALPLALIAIGLIWFFITKRKLKTIEI